MTSSEIDVDPSSIVVGADGSDSADRALSWAVEQAFLERRSLTVVTVVAAADDPSGAQIADEAAAVARHLRGGVDVHTAVLVGDPRDVFDDLSERVSLIVLGSRGRGVFRSRALGSVSAAVMREAACPVVICRPPRGDAGPFRGILVGADGTPESVGIIEFAYQQASLTGLPVTVVHCLWDENRLTHEPELVSAREPGLEEYRLLLAESVAGMSAKFPEVEAHLQLARGLAEEFLGDTTEEWNLVVVGRHPVDSVLRLVTGAVATFVVERAHTAVVVVPEGGARRTTTES